MSPISSGEIDGATVEGLTELVLKEARNEFMRTKGHSHVAIVIYPKEVKLFSFMANSRDERNKLVRELTGLIKSSDARGVFQVAEAWSAPAPADGGPPSSRPGDHPERREILLVQREWRGEKSLAWSAHITRTPNVVAVGMWEGPSEAISGLMLLMKPKGN